MEFQLTQNGGGGQTQAPRAELNDGLVVFLHDTLGLQELAVHIIFGCDATEKWVSAHLHYC